MIHVSARAGLCNRLRVINACRQLAEECNERLTVHWERTADMNVFFSDLFCSTDSMRLIEKGFSRFSLERFLFSNINPFFISHHEADRFVKTCFCDRRAHSIYFESFYDVYRNEDYSWLRPIETIQAEIDANGGLAHKRIGVHIRRTDHKKCIENSPLHLFIDRMADEVRKDPEATFFLSSDDESVKSQLQRDFPGKVYTREKVSSRNSVNGVPDAVVDLFLLARTKRIYGSYPSSFSAVAAQIGHVSLEYLTIENPWGDGPRV